MEESRPDEFLFFIKKTNHKITRIMFKIRKNKDLSEEDVQLLNHMHTIYTKYYEKD